MLGALELARPGEGDVLPHERTTPKAKSDRLRLLQATATNLSPIWGLSMARGLSAALSTDETPEARWTDPTGVTHEYWRIDDPATCARIAGLVGSAPVVVADGHHRYEAALAYRDERRSASASEAADRPQAESDFILALLADSDDPGVRVLPTHRVVHGLPGFDAARLRKRLAAIFDLEPAPDAGGDHQPLSLEAWATGDAIC